MKIFVFLFIISLSNLARGLRWTKSGFVSKQSNREVISVSAPDSWNFDVYKGEQITIVYDATSNLLRINLYCFVSGFTEASQIVLSFCKAKDCYAMANDIEKPIETNMKPLKFEYTSKFASKTGAYISLHLTKDVKEDVSGNYYCTAEDKTKGFRIQSNYIQIRDKIYWDKNLYQKSTVETVVIQEIITAKDVPRVFPCKGILISNLPNWIKMEYFSPAQWIICPVLKSDPNMVLKERMDPNKCQKYVESRCDAAYIDEKICPKRTYENDPLWNMQINNKGELLLTELKTQYSNSDMTYVFMCYTKSEANTEIVPLTQYYHTFGSSYYEKGVVLDGTQKNTGRTLRLLSPAEQTLNIYANVMEKKITLNTPPTAFVLHESNEADGYEWRFNNNKLNENNNIQLSRFSVRFTGDITADMQGVYELIVRQGSQSISGKVQVNVLGYPELKYPACLPLIRYVEEDKSILFNCSYINRPTSMELHINSHKVPLINPLDKISVYSQYPYLTNLNFTAEPLNYGSSIPVQESIHLSYQVSNLHKSDSQTEFPDHSVTFHVTNDLGLSIRSSSIYVVPQLKNYITSAPEKDNCTANCLSTQMHQFKCTIDFSKFANKELHIEHYWSIQNNRLDQISNPDNLFAPYFKITPNTKDLEMLPILSNNTDRDNKVKAALKNNFIDCIVVITGSNESQPLYSYNSQLDEAVSNVLRAKITLDYQEVTTAALYWIIALVLGLIVLIILIVFIVRYCRDKGETYQLDKIERKHGYNPDEEVKDELFKPYEREEQDTEIPDLERRNSLTNHSVGSYDDGELDNYDLDHSKFNEDGSIIGEYGANPRARNDWA